MDENKRRNMKNPNIIIPIAVAIIAFVVMMITLFGGDKDRFADCKVGDIVEFGAYEQDNNSANGKEAIEWRVLAREDGKILLISDKCLDAVPYNEKYTSVTWETCPLRKWLNDDFLNAAFTKYEQKRIIDSKLSNPDNPSYGTEGGNETTDKVFLLSIDEANEYFSSADERMAEPTEYAEAQGVYISAAYDTAWWWLRSPGDSSNSAADVDFGGGVINIGDDVNYDNGGVRPALWINLES